MLNALIMVALEKIRKDVVCNFNETEERKSLQSLCYLQNFSMRLLEFLINSLREYY